jgi:hypothetical protein
LQQQKIGSHDNLLKFVYSLRDLISAPPPTKSTRSNYQLISTNLLDLFVLKNISQPKRETLLLVDFVGGGAEIKSLREYTNFSRF